LLYVNAISEIEQLPGSKAIKHGLHAA
jgi:hypothetical protein